MTDDKPIQTGGQLFRWTPLPAAGGGLLRPYGPDLERRDSMLKGLGRLLRSREVAGGLASPTTSISTSLVPPPLLATLQHDELSCIPRSALLFPAKSKVDLRKDRYTHTHTHINRTFRAKRAMSKISYIHTVTSSVATHGFSHCYSLPYY